MKRHKHVAKPQIFKQYEADIVSVGETTDEKGEAGEEDESKVLDYMGKNIREFFVEFNEFDHSATSKRANPRKAQPPPPKAPPPAQGPVFDNIIDLHIPTGEEKEEDEEWQSFQKFVAQVASLTRENYSSHWRKLKEARGGLAPKGDSAGMVSSDDHPEVYELPTGETIEVEDPAAKQDITAVDHAEAAHNDDIWADIESTAKVDPTENGDDWVSFG